jgi:hypothetical protein
MNPEVLTFKYSPAFRIWNYSLPMLPYGRNDSLIFLQIAEMGRNRERIIDKRVAFVIE